MKAAAGGGSERTVFVPERVEELILKNRMKKIEFAYSKKVRSGFEGRNPNCRASGFLKSCRDGNNDNSIM